MIFCTECGTKLPDGSLFCEECGARVVRSEQPAQEAPVQAGADAEAPLTQQAPATVAAPVQQADSNPAAYPAQALAGGPAGYAPVQPAAKKFNKLLIVIPLVAAVLAAAIFVGPKLLSGGGKGEIPVIYVKDGDTLRFYGTYLKAPATITSSLTSGQSLSARISQDGRQLLYLDSLSSSGANLYMRNVDSEKPDNADKSERGTKLASDVSFIFFFTDDSKYVIYAKEDGGLYYHDGKEAHKLDSDIYMGAWPSVTDNNRIFYFKTDGDNKYTLYTQLMGGKGDSKIKIDDEISSPHDLDISEDGGYVMYVKEVEGDIEAYRYAVKNEQKDKLTGNASNIIRMDAASGSMLYKKSNTESLSRLSILGIEDDMAESDANMPEPLESDYQTTQPGIFGDRQVLDMDAYREAWSEYDRKLMRDMIRQHLEESVDTQSSDIYLYKDGQETKLITGLIGEISGISYSSLDNGFMIYWKSDLESGDKVRLSEMEDYDSFMNRMNSFNSSNLSRQFYYVPLPSGEGVSFYSCGKNENVSSLMVTEDGKTLAFLVTGESSGGELYTAELSSGAPDPAKADDDVFYLLGDYKDAFLYIKDAKDEIGALYSIAGSGKKKIAEEVMAYSVAVNDGESSVSYFRDWNHSKGYGDYYLSSGSEPKRLSGDVSEAYYRHDKLIYLLKNYNYSSNKGDLFAYVGKDQLELLDYDVNYVAG